MQSEVILALQVQRHQISMTTTGKPHMRLQEHSAVRPTCYLRKCVDVISIRQLHKANLTAESVDPLEGQSQVPPLKDFLNEWLQFQKRISTTSERQYFSAIW